MKILNLSIALFLTAITSTVLANTNGFISIPASAFSEKNSQAFAEMTSYRGNDTGTSRYFSGTMFAPLNLPHGSVVTSFSCGSKPKGSNITRFTLRRNEPQQANIDMAVIDTLKPNNVLAPVTHYQILNTISIKSGGIDNSKFNYYIVASSISPFPNANVTTLCNSNLSNMERCGNVNFCRVGYTIVERNPSDNAGKFK